MIISGMEEKLELLKNLTLLIVDDDDYLLQSLKSILNLFFDNIYIASNGSEAFKIYENQNIDIIVTDYVMPIMDGYSLCKKIRTLDSLIPIIIISNHSDKEKLIKAIPLNLVSYLIKPVNYDELTLTLRELVDRISSQKLFEHNFSKSLKYNRFSKNLIDDGVLIKLSKSEIILIELFIKKKNQIVTQDMISYALNEFEEVSYHGIKNMIYRLRQKIGKDTIVNVKSLGFIYCSDK